MDYKDTIITPKTDFPMRAGLPKREPEMLRRWDEENDLSTHRCYLLNELDGSEDDCQYKSRVSIGLVWDL